jgi:hypothetical protein
VRTIWRRHAACRHVDVGRERQGQGTASYVSEDHNANHNPSSKCDADADVSASRVWGESDSDGSGSKFGHDGRFDGLDEIVKAQTAQRLGKARRDAPRIEVSWGELVDRYTIIELKLGNATGLQPVGSLEGEFANLQREMDWFLETIPGADVFYKRMNLVNSRLWRLENRVRALIRAGDTGDDFIKTARSITLTNEKRSALKSAINKVAATGIEEVKLYHLPPCTRR